MGRLARGKGIVGLSAAAILAGFGFTLAATAQILQDAASVDATSPQRSRYEISAGERWSDNFGLSPTPHSGSVGTLGLLLDGARHTGFLQFDAKSDLDVFHYLSGNFHDEVVGRFLGTASYQFIPKTIEWVIDERYGQVARDYLKAPSTANRQYLNVLSTGPDLQARLGNALVARLSARYGRDDYQTSPYSATHLSGQAALERRPSDATLIRAGINHERVDYLETSARPGNFSIDRFFGGYSINGKLTRVDLEGGYSRSSGGLAQLHGFTGHAGVERRLSASGTAHIVVSRTLNTVTLGARATDLLPSAGGFTPANVLTGSLFFSDSAEAGYTWQRPRTTFDVNAVILKETDHQDIRPDRDLLSAGAKLSHRLTPLLEVTLFIAASQDTLHYRGGGGLPFGDFKSTDSGFGATLRQRFSRVLVGSVDLTHTQRASFVGPFRENAVWLRAAYAPQMAILATK